MIPRPAVACAVLLVVFASGAGAEATIRLAADTPEGQIVRMDQAKVDPSALPLVEIRSFGVTGAFADYAEWEGPTVAAWKTIAFQAADGYRWRFTGSEIDTAVLFLAVKVNGETLPKAHGFPVRLVAPGLTGSCWVKWITEIRLE